MFNNKKIMFLLLTLVFIAIMGVSAATAADIDNNATDAPVIADDTTTQASGASIESDVVDNSVTSDVSTKNTEITKKTNANLKSEGEGTFADLETDIADSDVTLTKDYVQGDDESNITITEDKVIDGDGHTITATKGIFNINDGVTLTFKNAIVSSSHGPTYANYWWDLYNKGTLIVNNVTFKYNSPERTYGGEIWTGANSNLTVIDSVFDGEHTVRSQIYADGVDYTMTIDGCEFTNYNASNAAIGLNKRGNVSITNCYFHDNIESSYGGAIYVAVNNINIVVDSCNFENLIANFRGGAIYNQGNLTVTNNTFKSLRQARPTYNAGIIYMYTNYASLYLANNTAEDIEANAADVYIESGQLLSPVYVDCGNITVDQEDTITLTCDVTADEGISIDFKNSPFIMEINDQTIPITYGNGTITATIDASYDPGNYSIVITANEANIPNGVTIPEATLTVNDIGLLRYENVTEKVANAHKGDEVIIDGKVVRSSAEDSIVIDKMVTINFNGNTIDAKKGKVFDITESAYVTIKNAIITNVGNPSTTVYNSEGRIANVTSGAVTFENVTFQDCTAPNYGSSAKGSFILAFEDAYVEIKDCYITNCSGTFVNNVNSNVKIDNTTFKTNLLYQGYSANWDALIANGGKLNINNSQFVNNSVNIAMIRGQSNTLPSGAYGSYITYYNQPMTIDNTLFEDNYASSGRGAAINTQNDTTITNSTFIYNRQNSYSNYGGAIFSEDGLLDIDSCIFINNSARYSVSSYSGSVSANEGTAIYNAKGDMNIRNSLIISNVTAVSAIYNAASDGEVIANYNYWGNATPEGFYKSTSSGSDITVDNWVILNVTVDPEENINYKDEVTVKATLNQYTDGTEVYDLDTALPEYGTVTFSSKDGEFGEETVDMINGEASTTYLVKADTFKITAAYPNMEAEYVGEATMPEALVITLNDGNWTSYFNDDGTVNEEVVTPNSELRFEGVFNERDMIINIPLNLTTAETQAVLNNCTFTVMVDNVNITDIEMNDVDYAPYLINLTNVDNTRIEGNVLTLTNNEETAITHAIEIAGGNNNAIINNTITNIGPEEGIVYDASGNILTIYTTAIQAVGSEGLIINTNKITTKASNEGDTFATIYNIYVKGSDMKNRLSSLEITENEFITESNAYAYGPSIYYADNLKFDSNNITTTGKDYADGAQFYLCDYASIGNNIITATADVNGYGVLLNGYLNYSSYSTTLIQNASVFNNVVDVTANFAWGIEGYLGRYANIVLNNVTLDSDYGVGVGFADVQYSNVSYNNINVDATMEGESEVWDSVPVHTAGVKVASTSWSSPHRNNIIYNNITITTTSAVKSPAVNITSNYNTVTNNYLDSPYGIGDLAVVNTGSYGNTISSNTPGVRVITLNDGNWTYYFNEGGTPNARQVIAGSELRFEGEFNERDMIINMPLNLTTADEQAVLNNCTFTVTANNVNITNIEMNAEDYAPSLILLNKTRNVNIEGNTLSLTNNVPAATTHTIEVLGGSDNVIRNNIITTVAEESNVVYNLSTGNMISFPSASIHALASDNIVIDSNLITTKPKDDTTEEYGTIYGIFIRGDYDKDSAITGAQIINNEIITDAEVYAYGVNVDYADDITVENNNVTTSGTNYADGIQVYSITGSKFNANKIVSVADNYAYGIIVNGKFDWNTYYLYMAEGNEITDNVIGCDADTVYLIELYMASENTVSGNNLSADVAYPVGIATSDSSSNIIQYNNINLTATMDKEVVKSDLIDYYPAGIKISVNPSYPMASSDENGVQYNNVTITSPEGKVVAAVNLTSDSNMVYENYLISSYGAGNAAVFDEGEDNYIDENLPLAISEITLSPIEDTQYGEKVLINGTLQTAEGVAIAGVNVTITVNDEEYTATTKDDGSFFYVVKATQVGENTVTATFEDETRSYSDSSAEGNFEVALGDCNITIDDIDDVKYSENVTITGTFTTASGTPLSKSTLKLVINGVNLKVKTDTEGVFTYTTKATTMGENTVTVSYDGYGNYNPAEETTTFNVIKQDLLITIDEIPDVGYNETVTVSGMFTDVNGVALGNSKLTVKVNGEKQTVTTEADGSFTFETQSVIAGENNVTVAYGGYAKYNEYQANATFNVVLEDTFITVDAIADVTYKDSVTITGKLTDANGKAFKKSTVTITLNGKNIKVKTDDQGVYTYTFNATTMDLNTVKVAYEGYGKVNPSEAETTFTVNKKDTTVTVEEISYKDKRVTLSGKLTDINGVALANSKVKVTLNGKVSYVVADADGSYTFTGYVADGKATYTVGYFGTSNYNEYTSDPVSLTFA